MIFASHWWWYAHNLVEEINQAWSLLLIFTRISRLSVNVLKPILCCFVGKEVQLIQVEKYFFVSLGLIRLLRNQLPCYALSTFNDSNVMPYISSTPACLNVSKVIWLIGNYVHGENDTVNCYRKLMILNVSQLHDYQLANFVFQSIYGFSPEIFHQMLTILRTTVMRLEIWMIWYTSVQLLEGKF